MLYLLCFSKYLDHLLPSPNRDDPDLDCLSDPSLLSPRVAYRSLHTTYQPLRQQHSFDSTESHRHRKFRRSRDCNYDEEYKRNKEYRSDDSFDSVESFPRSPKQGNGITCVGADLAGLVRRVRGMRVSVTPETCV